MLRLLSKIMHQTIVMIAQSKLHLHHDRHALSPSSVHQRNETTFGSPTPALLLVADVASVFWKLKVLRLSRISRVSAPSTTEAGYP